MKAENISSCPVCDGTGKQLYVDVEDYFFGISGKTALTQCNSDSCGHIWQNPMIVDDDIKFAYSNYYTHSDSMAGQRNQNKGFLSGRSFYAFDRLFVALFGLARKRVRFSMGYLDEVKTGSLLDVGCGNGSFAAKMKGLGWKVRGTDFDPVLAEQVSNEYDFPVHIGTLNEIGFESGMFDVLTARHVMEHVRDPIEFLRECIRLVKPGGRMVFVTPNTRSAGHLYYNKWWRGLEQPRHLNLFCASSVKALLQRAGISESTIFSTAQGAVYIFRETAQFQNRNRSKTMRWLAAGRVWMLYIFELIATEKMGFDLGEELVIIVNKPLLS